MFFRLATDSETRPADWLVPAKVDGWYDRSTRSHITMVVDAYGNQVGEAAYDGTKAGRDVSRRWAAEKIAAAKQES